MDSPPLFLPLLALLVFAAFNVAAGFVFTIRGPIPGTRRWVFALFAVGAALLLAIPAFGDDLWRWMPTWARIVFVAVFVGVPASLYFIGWVIDRVGRHGDGSASGKVGVG